MRAPVTAPLLSPARSRTRSLVGTSAVFVSTLLVVTVAVVVPGGNAPEVQARVGDGGVWVTSAAESAVGRVNTDIAELNVAVPLRDAGAQVVQSGRNVIVVDRPGGTATRVDPATARPAGSISLPRDANELTIVGPDALLTSAGDGTTGDGTTGDMTDDPSDGRVWSIPLAAFDGQDSPTAPRVLLDLGRGGVLAPTPDGGAIAISPTTGQLLRAQPGTPLDRADRTSVPVSYGQAPPQLVATTTGWAMLVPSAATLVTPAGPVDLTRFAVSSSAGLALQTAADPVPADSAPADSVLVASDTSLIEVDLATNEVSVISTGHGGSAVRPVATGGCAFAAWSDGTSWQRCQGDPRTGVAGVFAGLAASDRPVFRSNDGRVVLNDPVSGRAWVPPTDSLSGATSRASNRAIDNWAELLESGSPRPAARAEGAPLPVAMDPVGAAGPVRTISFRDDPPRPAQDEPAPAPSSAPEPAAGVAEPPASSPPQTQPLSPPPSGVAGALAPLPTTVRATLFGAGGVAKLAWAPFDGRGSTMTGYFVQSLGVGVSTADAPCTVSASGVVSPPQGGEVLDVGAWTSGTVGGIDQAGASYGFVVWGYSSAGCSASELATVTPLAPPSAVTGIDGSMVETGTDYDYNIASIAPRAARYEVQRLDAAGSPAGDVAEISLAGSAAIPRALTGGPFGEVYTFRMRACNAQDEGAACGPWSAQAAPEASLTFQPADLSYSAETGTWSWTSLPQNGSLPVKVRCGSVSDRSVVATNSRTECWTADPLSRDDAWLRVFVGSHSRTFP